LVAVGIKAEHCGHFVSYIHSFNWLYFLV
jgi:hypothetical protein